MALAVFIVIVLVGGVVIGALARLAVPGPDPMPIWLTAAFGIVGAALGGLVTRIFFGPVVSLPLALLGAIVLLVLYRRVIQGRGITGPRAKEQPTRGWGLRQKRQPQEERLDRLARLRNAGVITPEEYEARRTELPERQEIDLEKLTRLRDAGVITQQEFDARRGHVPEGR